MRQTLRLAAALLAFAIAFPAVAKTFTNAYVSFELPDKWNCVLEQTEWVCTPGTATEQQQATIILTAKEVGPGDSLPAYSAHLKIPKQIQGRAGSMITSEVLTVEEKKLADQPWVDGFHKSSEVPNYLTRYLVTTKGKIAVGVTFTAYTLSYSKYAQDFLKAIGSLRVIAPKDMGKGTGGMAGGDGPFGSAGPVDFASGDGALPEEQGAGGGSKGSFGEKTKTVLLLAVALAAIGVYLMIKKNKKKR